MSKIIVQQIFKQIRNYPFLYNKTYSGHISSRKCERAWEQIKVICKKRWPRTTLSEKVKIVLVLQKIWESPTKRKLLDNMVFTNFIVQGTNSDEEVEDVGSTAQTQEVPANDKDSIGGVDKKLLVSYLVSTYKLLLEEDEQETLDECYNLIKKLLEKLED